MPHITSFAEAVEVSPPALITNHSGRASQARPRRQSRADLASKVGPPTDSRLSPAHRGTRGSALALGQGLGGALRSPVGPQDQSHTHG